jgi:uncharacterized protein YhaN
MRIVQIYVDGYGMFCDFSLDDLSPAATVILGPNESGKTTLLSFIRTVLFGFLSRRGAESLYEPLSGGRHGGHMNLVDSRNDRFILERYAGPKGGHVTLTLPDGSVGGTSDLAVLLGHTSRDLFRNVFAFSLAELQDFETLSSDDVRARIYGAGLGAGRLGLPEIEKKIDHDRGELYKEGGSKQSVAVLIREADDVGKKLREFVSQVEEHDRLRADLEKLNLEIEAKAEERQKRYVERDHTANLLRAWDDWTELRSADEQVKQLPEVNEFPPEGITRLERSLQRRDDLRDSIEELKNHVAGNQQELEHVDVDERVLERKVQIEGLNRGLDKYESSKEDLPKRESELKSALEDLRDGLRDLGPGWDEERARTFDTSVPAREAVRGHGEKLRVSSVQLHDAERDRGKAEEDLENAAAERDRARKEWRALSQPPERNRKMLEEKQRKLRELRSLHSTHERRRQEANHLEDRKGDLQTRGEWIERRISKEVASLPIWPVVLVPLIGLAAAVLLALLIDPIGALVMAAAGVAVGAGYVGLRRRLEASSQKGLLEDELKTVGDQVKKIEGEAATVASRLETEESSIVKLAEELGINTRPDEPDIDGVESELEEALDSLGTWEAAEKRVKEAEARTEEQEKRVRLAKENESKAREEVERAKKAWHGWLEKRNIDVTISPETCIELLSMVEGLREKIKAADGLRKRIRTIEGAMEGYETQANAVRRACNFDERGRSAFPAAVDQLLEASRVAKESSDRVEQLRKAMDGDKARLKTLETAAEEVGGQIEGLLSEAGATDEEDFRRRAEIFSQREKLLAAIRDRIGNLERIAGRDRLDGFMSELEVADPEQLQQKQREVSERIDEIEEDLDERREKRAQVTEQIRQMETEEESSELRLRQAVLREQLSSEARKWSVLTIGQALLAETRLKYERERQPAVIQEAQRFFSSFTTGRYERIFSLPGENRIAVEDRTGKRKDTFELSRGTVEQLYLALRFGLVREFARRAEPMPVIMDDILVNFDPDRAREACRALGELSEDQQVLLFTCHPETVELIRAEAGGCKIIELPPLGV